MNSVKKNLVYQIIYEVLVVILPLATSPYISRVLGVESLGIYSFTYSVAYFFQLFAMLGIKFYGNRLIAAVRDDRKKLNKAFSELLVIHVAFSLLSLAIYLAYIIFISKDNELVAMIQLLVVFSSLFDISWLYFGLEKFKLTVTRNVIIKIITVILIFSFVRHENDLWIYTLIMSMGIFVSQIVLWGMLKNYVSFTKISLANLKVHIKPLFILFVPIIALSMFKYMDKIMLGIIGSKTELGFFENAEKGITIPSSIILAFGAVMLPRISNLEANSNRKESARYMALSMKYISWLAIGMAFGIAGVATEFAPVFWGSEFSTSGLLIKLLAISIPFSAVANVIRTQCLIPTGKDKLYTGAIISGAVVNLIINWTLIPSLQSLGAVIGTILAEIVVCCVQVWGVRKEWPFGQYVKSFIFFFVPGVFMYITLRFMASTFENNIILLFGQIIIGTIIYLTISAIYLYITKDKILLNMLGMLKRYSKKRYEPKNGI